MTTCDLIVVGTSQAGRTLALDAARQGQAVTLIEPPRPLDEDDVARQLAIIVGHLSQAASMLPQAGLTPDQVDFPHLAQLVKARLAPRPWVDAPPTLTHVDRAVRFIAPGVLGDGQQEYRATRIVLDLGRELLKPAQVQGLIDAPTLTAASLLDLPSKPARLAVLGAGRHGVQIAQTMAQLGSQVHLIDREQRVLPRLEEPLAVCVQPMLETAGVTVHLGTSVLRVSHRDQRFTLRFADDQEIIVDALLLATGTCPRTQTIDTQAGKLPLDEQGHFIVDARYETSVPGVFAIGSCIDQPPGDERSRDDAQRLWALWQGQKRRRGDRVRVLTLQTYPPVVRLGLTVDEAELAGYRLAEWAWPVQVEQAANQASQSSSNGTPGEFLRLLIDQPSGKLLGATVQAVDAATITPLLATLIAQGRPWRDLALPWFEEGSLAHRLQAMVIGQSCENAPA